MREKLAAFRKSRLGQYVEKVQNDRAPNLAVLLAWGTLNTLFPLVLGILALAGFVLRDPQRIEQLTTTLFSVMPQDAAATLTEILNSSRENAGAASIISILLLLFSGSNFFANMQMVFNLAYHVENRNFIVTRVLALVMLLIVTALLLVSTTAYGLGSLIGSLPIALPFGPVLGRLIGWTVSIVSAVLMFLLLYKILPNKPQGWKQTLPGAVLGTVLFFVILQVFPLYLTFFGKGFETYAAFGVFLLVMFWVYLLGLILVLGAELNAFLEEPERATALAETTAKAEKGQVETQQGPGGIATVATGDAAPGAADAKEPAGQTDERHPFGGARKPASAPAPGQPQTPQRERGSVGIGGRLIGLVGLLGAALLLSRQRPPTESAAPRS